MHPKILIVEDDPDIRNMLAIKLSNTDFPTMFNVDGLEVITMVEQFTPDIIVLDIQLPKKNGLEILEEIKNNPNTRSIPVVMFSNNSSEDDQKRALELGAIAFYVKAVTSISDFVKEVIRLGTLKQA